MATETVIYVSLALVLLTRIYVFISPPDFLEEHKDRRYHEYHLYRQYHLHKQYDKSDDHALGEEEESTITISRRLSNAQQQLESSGDKTNPLQGLHHPSDELVLLGMGPGVRPFPLPELSAHTLSKLEPLDMTSSRSQSSSSSSLPREKRGHDTWSHMIGPSMGEAADVSLPNYLSLDVPEIHYSGSLEKFGQDPEVIEAVLELKAGQRDMAKECPTMTVVWEGGRWCCLEGRTLYILRALNWQGQVRVRVLVDKDATMLAVTEEYWRAAGMTSDLKPLIAPTITASASALSSSLPTEEYTSVDESSSSSGYHTSSAIASSKTVGLSLEDNDAHFDATPSFREVVTTSNMHFEPHAAKTKTTSVSSVDAGLGGINGGLEDKHDEAEHEVDSDGYEEDDERDTDEEDDEEQGGVEKRLETLDVFLSRNAQPRRRTLPSQRHIQKYQEIETRLNSPSSPLLSPKSKSPFKHHLTRQQEQHHERKISIPEFLLPPPLHDEQVYVIIDPASSPTTETLFRDTAAPRRDSGHGDIH
ncbi:hypothetical protein BGX28_010178 [Mortierella sp. GBA30]|nr:hypothetical protein BGX28_010178 [Mortierella sp. GBA30]